MVVLLGLQVVGQSGHGERRGFPGAAGGAPSPWAAVPSRSSSVGVSGAGMGAFKAENISLSENRQAKATGGTYRDFPHRLSPVTFPTACCPEATPHKQGPILRLALTFLRLKEGENSCFYFIDFKKDSNSNHETSRFFTCGKSQGRGCVATDGASRRRPVLSCSAPSSQKSEVKAEDVSAANNQK